MFYKSFFLHTFKFSTTSFGSHYKIIILKLLLNAKLHTPKLSFKNPILPDPSSSGHITSALIVCTFVCIYTTSIDETMIFSYCNGVVWLCMLQLWFTMPLKSILLITNFFNTNFAVRHVWEAAETATVVNRVPLYRHYCR